jgi:hypothetical protein
MDPFGIHGEPGYGFYLFFHEQDFWGDGFFLWGEGHLEEEPQRKKLRRRIPRKGEVGGSFWCSW